MPIECMPHSIDTGATKGYGPRICIGTDIFRMCSNIGT